MEGAAPGPVLEWGYRPESWPMRELRRQLRDLQTHFPAMRRAKFSAYNLATRHLGLFVDPEIRLLRKLAPLGLAIDVGGNWGQSVVALQRYARPRKIITIEPIPTLAQQLRQQFSRDSGVDVREMALGPASGEQHIHVPRYRNFIYDGIASLDREAALHWLDERRMARFTPDRLVVDSHKVRIETLDVLELAPDLIKIDVQGFESQVIGGGLKTIATHQPAIIIERPEASAVAVLGKLGLAPYGWNGKRLVSGDLTRKNAIFLSGRHSALLD
ncbi:FkbM family methyltransferase [Novosphingobium sp. ERW19]|uniref:FkbM family methyltransferase n=1 Tax=Novosphingobium sp. ERW19 TaxID=2726186 RepID=UPI001456FFF9|nr:FkbM family methyltransferase [Novosphingobium sp. ERW19]NLR38324.1 FkbM family methyltransferase [Novosphingobium sp. ERW19]